MLNKIWNLVLDGKAVAINSNGVSISGDNASGYSKFSYWKVVLLDDPSQSYIISDGKVKQITYY